MGPQRRLLLGRSSRTVLSIAAWLSALFIFAFVSWFYVFRHDTSLTRHQPPAVIVPVTEKDDIVIPSPDNVTASAQTPRIESATSSLSFSFSPTKEAIIPSALQPSMSPPEDATPTMALTTPPEPLPAKAGGASVSLRQGTYIGATIEADPESYPKAVDAFLGIPYAQSTSGENRFRPPVRLPDSTSTSQAAAYAHACLGANSGRPEGEDCLNVNVFRPRDAARVPGEVYGVAKPSHLLPVVIYVHGGGFNAGHGGERNMASFVSWAKQDIVAVSFNYRVGAFGFLPSALTAKEGLLNLGLKDQQALFTWVQDNIAQFGGDPSNVTIMGLSAGAHSIGHHLMYYSRTSGPVPFAKAILESGATTARATFYPTHPRHLVQFREFLVAAGIEGVPESEVFSTLRTLPAATILKASKLLWDKYVPSVTWPFQPVIDGPNTLSNSSRSDDSSTSVIPDLPLLSWQQGHHLAIPVLTGFNTNEGTQFIPADANTTADFRSFFSHLIPGFGPADLDRLEALYPDPVTDPASPYKSVPPGMGAQWTRLDAAYSHYAYICPVLQTAHFLSTSSPSSSSASSSGSAHNSYGLRSTVGETPSAPQPAREPAAVNPSTAEAHNSYGLTRRVGDASQGQAPKPSSPGPYNEQAHNSYGLRSEAGEKPFAPQAPAHKPAPADPSTAQAHNSYGLAQGVGKSHSPAGGRAQKPALSDVSNKEAHNSYGLRSEAGEEPSSPQAPAEKPSSNPSAAQAHNSYGLARGVKSSPSSSPVSPSGSPAPVYVYRYAAASRWGTANHGDEAPVVAHDILITSPSSSSSPTTSVTRPGLMKVADAMHAAWVNFIVSPAGDPNPVQVPGEESPTYWPEFVSPFAGTEGQGGKGKMIVFGEGNNERDPEAKTMNAGQAVGVQGLTEWELERCRFWWERVELSEGLGKRLDRGKL